MESRANPGGPAFVTVSVLGGNPIVGEALAQLLHGAGYTARFLLEAAVDELDTLLGGDQILLLAPGLSPAYRRELREKVKGVPAARVSVVRLITAMEDLDGEQESYVLWPCPVEKLSQRIVAVLEAADRTA